MAYLYSTHITNQFLDVLVAELGVGDGTTLNLISGTGALIASLPFNTPILKLRSEGKVELTLPSPAQALVDAEVVQGNITNALGVKLVTFGVGSATTNPKAELILNSTTIYMGGTISASKITLIA